jgi:hypothetical protein
MTMMVAFIYARRETLLVSLKGVETLSSTVVRGKHEGGGARPSRSGSKGRGAREPLRTQILQGERVLQTNGLGIKAVVIRGGLMI